MYQSRCNQNITDLLSQKTLFFKKTFAFLGLIHVGQSIRQHTNLSHLYKEPFDLECSVLEYRRCPQGIQVDLGFKVYDRREMCVWDGVTTLLSRSPAVRRVAPQLSFTGADSLSKGRPAVSAATGVLFLFLVVTAADSFSSPHSSSD